MYTIFSTSSKKTLFLLVLTFVSLIFYSFNFNTSFAMTEDQLAAGYIRDAKTKLHRVDILLERYESLLNSIDVRNIKSQLDIAQSQLFEAEDEFEETEETDENFARSKRLSQRALDSANDVYQYIKREINEIEGVSNDEEEEITKKDAEDKIDDARDYISDLNKFIDKNEDEFTERQVESLEDDLDDAEDARNDARDYFNDKEYEDAFDAAEESVSVSKFGIKKAQDILDGKSLNLDNPSNTSSNNSGAEDSDFGLVFSILKNLDKDEIIELLDLLRLMNTLGLLN